MDTRLLCPYRGISWALTSYALLKRKADAPGTLLGRQAAAGKLGQALGWMSAGSLSTLAPFWTTAAIWLLGAVLSMVWWEPARVRDIAGAASTKI